MKKKILAIVEARMNSKRLYGKVLKKINGVEILKIILDRLETSKKISEVIVATSNNREDDSIVKLLNKKKFKYFRGSEKNLIKRLIGAAEKFNADIVVRLTADNPLIYSKSIDFMINFYKKNLKFDYITIFLAAPQLDCRVDTQGGFVSLETKRIDDALHLLTQGARGALLLSSRSFGLGQAKHRPVVNKRPLLGIGELQQLRARVLLQQVNSARAPGLINIGDDRIAIGAQFFD